MTPLARTPILLMLCAFAGACLAHVDRVPLWCTVAVACDLLWYWLHITGRRALPGRWARYLLTIALLGGVLLSFGTVNGLAAGSALLMAMGGAKLLETRSTRDAVVVTTVALILVLAACLDRQHLLRLPLYLAVGWAALATIAALGSRAASRSAVIAFRRAGGAMLLAVPFAVLAFIFVPRLPGALWSMPGGDRAQTGLADEMSPGSISDLAVSDAIAFRVIFDGAVPLPQDRYWRGPVLHDFDGATWRRGAASVRNDLEPLSAPIRYLVMLEPHQRAWLFTLEHGAEISGRRHLRTFDNQFLATLPVSAPLNYRAVSHASVRPSDPLSDLTRQRDTRLPGERNPRSAGLARSLREASASDADFADRLLRYFGGNGFEYTLTPPRLNRDSVDDLLFNTRLGFCGHFASAYVSMMRAAGVPARVVTGYLGGSWNPIGGYLLVRQSDAHAWAEVWLEGSGWTRFDPTAMVAPARLQRSLGDLLPQSRSAVSSVMEGTGWLRNLRDAWDAAGSWWRLRVVGFNSGTQRDLLAWLGLGDIDYRGMAMVLLAGAALWAAVLLVMLRRAPRQATDTVAGIWGRWERLLARRGLRVAEHDGPEAIRARARQAWPAAAAAIDEFTAGYERLRFGGAPAKTSDADARLLRGRLRTLARLLGTAPPPRPRT